MAEKPKPIFDRRIFWDVDFDKLDYDARANFVIERVFERGDVEDIRQCRRYYGDEKVTEVLLNAKFLPEHRIHLASAVIGKPLEEFRCYILRRSSPGRILETDRDLLIMRFAGHVFDMIARMKANAQRKRDPFARDVFARPQQVRAEYLRKATDLELELARQRMLQQRSRERWHRIFAATIAGLIVAFIALWLLT